MSNGLLVFCTGLSVFSFCISFFLIRDYGIHQGMKPGKTFAVLWPALRDKSHPMKSTSIVFIISLLGAAICGVVIALNNSHPIVYVQP